MSFQGSLKKWCSNGVASTFLLREIIDFMSFSGIHQDIAVANEKYVYHRWKLLDLLVFSFFSFGRDHSI